MANEMMSWQELLTFQEFDDYTDEYGPHTQAVVNAFETLETISWFSAVGAETGLDVDGVDTWGEALAPIIDKSSGKYSPEGHPTDAAAIVQKLRSQKGIQKHLNKAINDVEKHVDYADYIPSYFDKIQKSFMISHIDFWLHHMLAEIVSDTDECTYFRELLPWYEAGHFPCGWDGDWPKGRPRVF